MCKLLASHVHATSESTPWRHIKRCEVISSPIEWNTHVDKAFLRYLSVDCEQWCVSVDFRTAICVDNVECFDACSAVWGAAFTKDGPSLARTTCASRGIPRRERSNPVVWSLDHQRASVVSAVVGGHLCCIVLHLSADLRPRKALGVTSRPHGMPCLDQCVPFSLRSLSRRSKCSSILAPKNLRITFLYRQFTEFIYRSSHSTVDWSVTVSVATLRWEILAQELVCSEMQRPQGHHLEEVSFFNAFMVWRGGCWHGCVSKVTTETC